MVAAWTVSPRRIDGDNATQQSGSRRVVIRKAELLLDSRVSGATGDFRPAVARKRAERAILFSKAPLPLSLDRITVPLRLLGGQEGLWSRKGVSPRRLRARGGRSLLSVGPLIKGRDASWEGQKAKDPSAALSTLARHLQLRSANRARVRCDAPEIRVSSS